MESATVAKEDRREVGSLIISKAGDYGVRSHPEPVRPGGERHAELESMIIQPRFHRFGLAVRHCYICFSAISGDRIILDSPFDAERKEDLVSHSAPLLMITVCSPRI
jgi:hypothetical protein